MKKLIISLSLVGGLALSSSAAFATGASCGVGARIFSGQSGLIPHIFAETTNSTYYTNLTSMSFDLAGCDTSGPIARNSVNLEREVAFLNDNVDSFVVDLAAGHGESIDNFLHIKNVSLEDKDAVAKLLKNNFNDIYSNSDTDSVSIAMNINNILLNSKYSKYVA